MTTPSPAAPTPPNYKTTLNLPQTPFDMKANLTQREPLMLKAWQEQNLYKQIRDRKHPKGKWLLHDGPPYANGDIHMGHLINKTLKDIVVKFRTMQGHDAPYVPGWDCHGLPIESAIQKELGPKFRELTKEEVRNKCHAYAMKYVKLQGDSFQRLGILGDWARPYLTLDPNYEGGVLDVLAELVSRDLVYRQKKPVHWCINDRTALAEAELEYAKKKDSSIYVLLKLQPGSGFEKGTYATSQPDRKVEVEDVYLMVWTTTPWTLPANRAVAINPKHNYNLVHFADTQGVKHSVVIAEELVERVMKTAGIENFEQIASIRGGEWVGEEGSPHGLPEKPPAYVHPLDPTRIQPVVLADYVTLEDGTGLVHTAPGHGKEDYQTGKRENLEIYNPVLPDGKYDQTVPPFLQGQSIWDANQLVIDKLKELGTLFHHQLFEHDYPHCWRCKKPVIFRATEQWFVKASSGDESTTPSPLWTNAKKFVNQVQWIPEWGKNRIDGMLDTRPDWCVSRQRSWGVPIPAFFDEQGRTLISEALVRHVADYFRAHGATSWYTDSAEKILGADDANKTQRLQSLGLPADVDVSKLEKSKDILDVWFESGASHHAVLECTHPELGYPAQMYLEGSDQHRGWFQSSLLEASGYKSVPPFAQVLTHGFIVDEKGRKMSKSEGTDIKVEAALKEYGADVLRLWVSSVDYQNDMPCGKALFAKTADAYRKIRNTMRYLLGNLYDFNPGTDTVELNPHSIDAWMQTKLNSWTNEIIGAYDRYEFHQVFKLIYEFCNVEISSVYAKAIKDRLYCELPNSPKRRASQTVCYDALVRLIELTAPVLAFTAEEAWAAVRQLPGGNTLEPSVHLHVVAPAGSLSVKGINPFTKQETTFHSRLHSAPKHWSILMPLIESGNKQLDDLKKSVGLGNALDAEAVIILPKVEDDVSRLIKDYAPEIEDALGVGFHRIEHGETWDIKIHDTREKYPSCARSWKRRPDVGSDKDYPDLSARDAAVVRALRGK